MRDNTQNNQEYLKAKVNMIETEVNYFAQKLGRVAPRISSIKELQANLWREFSCDNNCT